MAQATKSQHLSLISTLVSSRERREAARSLAEHLGAEDLMLFIQDPEINILLPAPGFLQTLPSAQAWRKLLEECAAKGEVKSDLPFPDAGAIKPVTAIAGRDGSALALIGGAPRLDAARDLVELLPLLAAAFRGERAVLNAEGQTRMARQAATQSEKLAEMLNSARADLERALRTAEAASRAKDDFLATVSHELRTPLTPILGFARMLRSSQLDANGQERALASIERNAELQSHLIEDILDFARIIAGKLRLEVQPVDPAVVVEAAVDVVRPAALAKDVRLQVVLDPGAGPVSGDAGRLQQVIWNLLTNAVKFTPKGGRVQVRLERVNSRIEITISDTGEGITQDFLPYVFDRFRQADNSISRRHGGLGLGLSIVRQLVEMHGGSVDVYSDGLEQGSTFTVKLPRMIVHETKRLKEDSARRHPTSDEQQAIPFTCPPELAGLRVLVVDDEMDARDLLAMVLESCGAMVTTVGTAGEALDAVKRLKPDILVSDIEMPGEDGYSLIAKIRALLPEDGGRVPALALTAHARLEDRMRALTGGFQMHVAKPVEPAELVVVLASLVGRSEKQE
ncbi:MAG TPA: ATP-binding protein [Pyrinomonadaceae bacterium]|nr:ATP-binding protein [Pyrinomonadaceae bacterium]